MHGLYLNCAATSAWHPACVAEAMCAALDASGSTGRGAGAGDLAAARGVFAAREELGSLFGISHPERIVFAANATEALNMAIAGALHEGERAVATDWDHNAILRPLHYLKGRRGIESSFVPADRRGRLCYERLEELLAQKPQLVALTHASNLTGNVADVARVAEAAHAAGALVLLDASQTAGSFPIDAEALGIDLLAFTGHKALMGPQGTGGLYVAPGVELDPLLSGGTGVLSFEEGMPESYPEHLEAGTLNGCGIAGLAAAVSYVRSIGVDEIHCHDLALVRRFVAGVREIPGIVLYGDFPEDLDELDGSTPSRDHAPVVALNLSGWDSSGLAAALDEDYGIATRAGGHCAPRMHRALGTEATGAVRFSFGWQTAPDEIDAALSALRELAEEA